MSEYHDTMLIEVDADGRWIIGRKLAKRCPWCGADPVAVTAENGRAVVWRSPSDCCDAARARNVRVAGAKPAGAGAGRRFVYDEHGRVSK
jgi:hypothetical protein